MDNFEYMFMPVGLCNDPAPFQTLMNRNFHARIDDFMLVYMDDLLIFCKDEEIHFRHLRIILNLLRENHL